MKVYSWEINKKKKANEKFSTTKKETESIKKFSSLMNFWWSGNRDFGCVSHAEKKIRVYLENTLSEIKT